MPVLSKRVISYINSASKPFTLHTISKYILTPDKKKKGKKKRGNGRDLSDINSTLSALQSIGYIRKHKKSYIKPPDFKLDGVIRINSSGNGIMKTGDGFEVIITKENKDHTHNNDLVESEIIDYRNGFFYGRVIKIIRRKKERYLAQIERKTGNLIFLRIIDLPGRTEVYSKRDDHHEDGAMIGDFAIIRLKGIPGSDGQECRIERSFPVGSEEFDLKRIEIKYSIPGPHKAYDELEYIEKKIEENIGDNREDYRNLYTITIDGESAKDFDDAITLETLGDKYVLYIHIADVSHFVEKNSQLDREALKRGTSYYVGNSVIPMLPEIISNNLCSLKEGVDRFTLSVKITFNKKGKLLDVDYSRGLINVDKRLTYVIANKIVVDKGKKKLGKILKDMYRLAVLLKRNRINQGRVDLNLPEAEIVYSGNTVSDIGFAERYKSHTIIEEFMLSANEVVSRALKENRIQTLYRIHEDISDENLSSLKEFIRSLGLRLSKSKNIGLALQEIIDSVSGKEYEQVINFIVLKSMMQAYYGEKPLGHFGLGFNDYTHFTSPIRRYPDLVVHRCLKSLIDKSPNSYKDVELREIGERASEMERIAQRAERDLTKIKSCRLMQGRIGDLFDVIVSGISKIGFFVTLIDKPIEGMVPLRLLTDDYYLVREDDFTVIGKRRGKRFRLGDRIRVKLVNVEIENMRIDFEPQ